MLRMSCVLSFLTDCPIGLDRTLSFSRKFRFTVCSHEPLAGFTEHFGMFWIKTLVHCWTLRIDSGLHFYLIVRYLIEKVLCGFARIGLRDRSFCISLWGAVQQSIWYRRLKILSTVFLSFTKIFLFRYFVTSRKKLGKISRRPSQAACVILAKGFSICKGRFWNLSMALVRKRVDKLQSILAEV